MDKLNTIFIIIGIGVVALIVIAVSSTIPITNQVTYEMKLINGEISVFQYCAHIGKAAIDDSNCKVYNILYGPNS